MGIAGPAASRGQSLGSDLPASLSSPTPAEKRSGTFFKSWLDCVGLS
jgi:hypothetical protein